MILTQQERSGADLGRVPAGRFDRPAGTDRRVSALKACQLARHGVFARVAFLFLHQKGSGTCYPPGLVSGTAGHRRENGPMLELPKGSAPAVLLETSTEMILFGAIEMPAAPHYCDTCGIETIPLPLSNPSMGWNLFPCHNEECGCCYKVGTLCENCECVESCCECVQCGSCSKTFKDSGVFCGHCEWCENCCSCEVCDGCGWVNDCDCPTCAVCGCKGGSGASYGDQQCANDCGNCNDHCDCGSERCDCSDCRNERGGSDSRYLTPGWVDRGDVLPNEIPECVEMMTRDDRNLVNPVRMMADFYIADYIMAAIPAKVSVLGDDRNANILRQSAAALQSHIVALCDPVFQDYVFSAIGGEVRHHANCRGMMPGGRDSMWDYWWAMGEANGRRNLTEDCVNLFDDDCWGGSYGGSKWRIIATTLLLRLEGKLDAKTFVDRVFSLQHNGGSLLNKMSWADCAYLPDCLTIGNAHAADHCDFPTLGMYASHDGKMLLNLFAATSAHYVNLSDRPLLLSTIGNHNCTPDYASFGIPVPFFPRQSPMARVRKAERFRSSLARESAQVAQERHAYWESIGKPSYCDCEACASAQAGMRFTRTGVRKTVRKVAV